MELTNEFVVGVPPAQAWAVLTDVERIAPCLPGAELQEVEGDEYRGVVKVKVGPITAQYKGKARFLEQDEAGGRAVLRAEGRDTRGQGNANATITATLTPDGDGTKVSVVTDLAISGRVAQFGRGVLADVSAKLLDQFVACLETNVLQGNPGPAPEPAAEPAPEPAQSQVPSNGSTPSAPEGTIRRIDSGPAAPVDLLDAAGGSVARRAIPAFVAAILLILLAMRRRRRTTDRD
jgi:carbon monoxide dehydrogenase subunit G